LETDTVAFRLYMLAGQEWQAQRLRACVGFQLGRRGAVGEPAPGRKAQRQCLRCACRCGKGRGPQAWTGCLHSCIALLGNGGRRRTDQELAGSVRVHACAGPPGWPRPRTDTGTARAGTKNSCL